MTATANNSNPHIARLYVIVAMLAVFFVLWANIAMHPFSSSSSPASTPAVATSPSARILPGQQPVTYTTSSGVVVTQPAAAAATQPSAQVVSQQPVTATRTS